MKGSTEFEGAVDDTSLAPRTANNDEGPSEIPPLPRKRPAPPPPVDCNRPPKKSSTAAHAGRSTAPATPELEGARREAAEPPSPPSSLRPRARPAVRRSARSQPPPARASTAAPSRAPRATAATAPPAAAPKRSRSAAASGGSKRPAARGGAPPLPASGARAGQGDTAAPPPAEQAQRAARKVPRELRDRAMKVKLSQLVKAKLLQPGPRAVHMIVRPDKPKDADQVKQPVKQFWWESADLIKKQGGHIHVSWKGRNKDGEASEYEGTSLHDWFRKVRLVDSTNNTLLNIFVGRDRPRTSVKALQYKYLAKKDKKARKAPRRRAPSASPEARRVARLNRQGGGPAAQEREDKERARSEAQATERARRVAARRNPPVANAPARGGQPSAGASSAQAPPAPPAGAPPGGLQQLGERSQDALRNDAEAADAAEGRLLRVTPTGEGAAAAASPSSAEEPAHAAEECGGASDADDTFLPPDAGGAASEQLDADEEESDDDDEDGESDDGDEDGESDDDDEDGESNDEEEEEIDGDEGPPVADADGECEQASDVDAPPLESPAGLSAAEGDAPGSPSAEEASESAPEPSGDSKLNDDPEPQSEEHSAPAFEPPPSMDSAGEADVDAAAAAFAQSAGFEAAATPQAGLPDAQAESSVQSAQHATAPATPGGGGGGADAQPLRADTVATGAHGMSMSNAGNATPPARRVAAEPADAPGRADADAHEEEPAALPADAAVEGPSATPQVRAPGPDAPQPPRPATAAAALGAAPAQLDATAGEARRNAERRGDEAPGGCGSLLSDEWLGQLGAVREALAEHERHVSGLKRERHTFKRALKDADAAVADHESVVLPELLATLTAAQGRLKDVTRRFEAASLALAPPPPPRTVPRGRAGGAVDGQAAPAAASSDPHAGTSGQGVADPPRAAAVDSDSDSDSDVDAGDDVGAILRRELEGMNARLRNELASAELARVEAEVRAKRAEEDHAAAVEQLESLRAAARAAAADYTAANERLERARSGRDERGAKIAALRARLSGHRPEAAGV